MKCRDALRAASGWCLFLGPPVSQRAPLRMPFSPFPRPHSPATLRGSRPHRHAPDRSAVQHGWILALVLAGLLIATPAAAQQSGAFYLKAGVGLSDYAGDGGSGASSGNVTGLGDVIVDGAKFTDTDVVPYALSAEIGYIVSPRFRVGGAYQGGQYAFADDGKYDADAPNLGTVRHIVQLLGRYTIAPGRWALTPYLDGGVGTVFGGQTAGLGFVVGAGAEVPLGTHTLFFVEMRSTIVPDDAAVDGISGSTPVDILSQAPSVGLQYTLGN